MYKTRSKKKQSFILWDPFSFLAIWASLVLSLGMPILAHFLINKIRFPHLMIQHSKLSCEWSNLFVTIYFE